MLPAIWRIIECKEPVPVCSSSPLDSPRPLLNRRPYAAKQPESPSPRSSASCRKALIDRRISTLLLIISFILVTAAFPLHGQAAVRTLDRDESPVILTGEVLPDFSQVPLGELFVYAFVQGSWKQIPWQFDEVDGGHFTASGNGLLDDTDQLVFMGRDTGDQVPPHVWIDNAASRAHPRCEITVSDPLNPDKKGWVYVYRSNTDSLAETEDYVDLDEVTWLFTAANYRMGPVPDTLRVELLEMNGSGVNVLDRTKIRGQAGFLQFNEQDMSAPENRIFLNGRVRAIAHAYATATELTLTGYRSAYSFDFSIDFSELFPSFNWLRLSADFAPAAAGSTYYDANTIPGVTVDGSPDIVAETPATDWWQVSGPTGTVVQSLALADVGGVRSNYYKDDATIDPADFGDKKSYADLGSYLTAPNANLHFALWYDVLPANQPRLGATYLDYAIHPLQTQASMQEHNNQAMPWLHLLLNES